MNKNKEHVDYLNWVPKNYLIALTVFTSFFVFLTGLVNFNNPIVKIVSILISMILVAITVYYYICYNKFSYRHGRVMRRLYRFIISKLCWNGEGKILDIGCGSGEFAILLSKKYDNAKVIGVDLWKHDKKGMERCEYNAKLEKASNIDFLKADAVKLPFEDNSFDSVVSNFTFSEVETKEDRKELIKEALRVLKPGGKFAFNDMLEDKKLFGDMEEFIEVLQDLGISEIHYIPNVDKCTFMPQFLSTPLMLNKLGILYGRK